MSETQAQLKVDALATSTLESSIFSWNVGNAKDKLEMSNMSGFELENSLANR